MPGWATAILAALGHGQPLYMVLYAAMIVFFAFFYTAIVFNPKDTADKLKKHSRLHPRLSARASARPNTSTTC